MMRSNAALAVVLSIVQLMQGSVAFGPHVPRFEARITTGYFRYDTSLLQSGGEKGNDDLGADPTKSWSAGIADAIQNIVTNSPLNEGKKALARALAGNYDEVAVREKLDNLIANNPVLMLSFVKCPFCIKAKAVLDAKKASYLVVELDEVADGMALRAEMAGLIGRTSVPAIWIDGEFIGGCNDGPKGGIVKLNDSGQLNSMLASVKAI